MGKVGGKHDWVQVSAGNAHSCGIKSDGTLHCWGFNTSGQLGDNSMTDRLIPTAINGGVSWKQVSVGGDHSCGIKSDDTLYCWGLNTKEGTDKLAAWKANPGTATLPSAIVVSRQEMQKQPPAVVEAALRADPAALPAWVGVDLGDQGYSVVKVNKVLPREAPPPDVAKQERQQYAQAWASAENLAYYNVLKERFKVQMKVPKPAGFNEPVVPQ